MGKKIGENWTTNTMAMKNTEAAEVYSEEAPPVLH